MSASRKSPKKQKPQTWTPPFTNSDKQFSSVIFGASASKQKSSNSINATPTYTLPHPSEAETSPAAPDPKSKETANYKKEFIKTFKKLTYRWRPWDIWSDFVTTAACAISNAVDKSHFDEREALYMQTINKYSKEEWDIFPELFAYVVLSLDENSEQDFLGDIYTELGLNSKEHQQIFTPYHVCQMMAEMTIGDVASEVKEKGFITIHDCCCGGGATLIAAANVAKSKLEKVNLNFQNYILITGQDIDRIVVMMCYIQLSLLGVAGYFKVGDSLTDPMTSNDSPENYWFTPMYFSSTWKLRRICKNADNLMEGESIDGEV